MLKPALSLSLLLFTLPLHQQSGDSPTAATPTSATATPATPAPDAPIPAADAAKVNPVKATPATLAKARKMYGYDCAMCHGATGNGKGEVGAGMNLKDYTDPAALSGLSDGQLFYIIQNGRGQMSGEAGRQNEQEIWNMVLLVRSFSRK